MGAGELESQERAFALKGLPELLPNISVLIPFFIPLPGKFQSRAFSFEDLKFKELTNS